MNCARYQSVDDAPAATAEASPPDSVMPAEGGGPADVLQPEAAD